MEEISLFEYDSQLNRAQLHAMYRQDYEYAGEMFEYFLDSIDERLLETLNAINRREPDEVKRLVHMMRNTIKAVGLSADTVINNIATNTIDDDWEKVSHFYMELHTFIKQWSPLIHDQYEKIKAYLTKNQ